MESLTKQLATLEMKELNEKQRADHAENKYKLVQAQVLQLEKRNSELEIKFADTAKANLELQKTERSLRDQLGTSIPKEKFVEANAKVQQVEVGTLILIFLISRFFFQFAIFTYFHLSNFLKGKVNRCYHRE